MPETEGTSVSHGRAAETAGSRSTRDSHAPLQQANGGGLRLLEALRLRVKDVDFSANLLVVRQGKGLKDRRTMLPECVKEPLRMQIEAARRLHKSDLARDLGAVWLPDTLQRKFSECTAGIRLAVRVSRHETVGRPGKRCAREAPPGRVCRATCGEAGRTGGGDR